MAMFYRHLMTLLPARIARDLRDASRQLRVDKAYSLVVVVTMTIGIAAVAAIFAVVRGVILRPLPYRQANALVALQEFQPALRRDQTSMSYADFLDVRASARSFEALAAFNYSEFVLSEGYEAERVIGATVDPELLPMLGMPPMLGRVFERGESGQSPARVAVLAHSLWRRRYRSDPGVVGRSIVIDGDPYIVIGVMPERFEFPRNVAMNRDIELWTPRRTNPAMVARRAMRTLTVVGRLRPGIDVAVAQAELTILGDRLASADAQANTGWQLRAVPLRDVMVGRVRPTLLMLFACVVALLLIVCVNVSAAALARIVARRQVLGVRLALGASQGVLAELLLSESTFLALLAGALALPFSAIMRGALIRIAPIAIPRQAGIGFDLATLGFTALVALIVGAVTGLGPTLWLRRLDVRSFLTDSGRTMGGSRATRRTLAAFVIVQVALGTLLFGLTTRMYAAYARLNRVDPGFAAQAVTTASIALPGMRYQDARTRTALSEQLLDRVRALPGVDRAAVGSLLPMSGGMMSSGYEIVGTDVDSTTIAALRTVSSDFFQTVGIPLKAGRVIERTDDESAPLVAVVNEALVRQSLSGHAVGATIRVAAPGRDSAESFQVVGLVGDAKEKDLTAPATPIIYFSNRQASFPHTVLLLRSVGPAPIGAVRVALRDLDPSLALDDVGSLADKVRATYALQVFLLIVLSVFAVVGATLIAIGIHGTVSYTVAANIRAIGVRLALGATPGTILRSVIGRTTRLAGIGCAAGTVAFFLAPRLTTLFASGGNGAGMVAAAIGVAAILAVAAAASFVPALRASHADPGAVLRD